MKTVFSRCGHTYHTCTIHTHFLQLFSIKFVNCPQVNKFENLAIIFQAPYSKTKWKKNPNKQTQKLKSTGNHLFSSLEVGKKEKRNRTVAWRLRFNLLPNYQKYKLGNQYCSYTFMKDGFHLAAPKSKYLLYFTCSHFQWTSNDNFGHVYIIIWI